MVNNKRFSRMTHPENAPLIDQFANLKKNPTIWQIKSGLLLTLLDESALELNPLYPEVVSKYLPICRYYTWRRHAGHRHANHKR